MENLEQRVKEHEEVLLKYPKNIRQMGETGDGERIYVEDYVITYITHLASKAKDGFGSAVLLGKKAVVEGRRTIFISGAAEISQQWKQAHSFTISGEQWTGIYDQMQKYFHDVEIIGWFLTCPGMELTVNEQVRSVWHSSFEGSGKILYLYDSISREDAFYTNREGEFWRQSGYYIYYEKNEEMQNYIIDAKGGKSSDEGYQDIASGKIRKKIEEKNKEHKKYIFQQQIAYSMGILASAVVLVSAGTQLYHGVSGGVAEGQVGDMQQVSGQNLWNLKGQEAVQSDEENNEAAVMQQEAEFSGEIVAEAETVRQEQQEVEASGEDAVKTEHVEQNLYQSGENADGNFQNPGTIEEGASKNEQGQEVTDSADSKTAHQQTVQNKEDKELEAAGTKKNNTDGKEVYKVKKGDTLESISREHYGTSSYIKKIKRLNKLEDADKIYIGQKLFLP